MFFLSVVLIAFLIIFAISMQVTQQVYVAKDWVQIAHNKFDVEDQTRREVEKLLAQQTMKNRSWLRSLRPQRVRAKVLRLG